MRTSLIYIALFFFQQAGAQWFQEISTFTTQNGLSNNTVTCLQKDSTGFLWVGTHEGLNRYDGTEFIHVLSNGKNNFPSNHINRICFLSKGLLAVGTDAGLCLLNTSNLTGRRIDLPLDSNFATTGYYISDLLYNRISNQLWVATWHGVFVLSPEGKLLEQIMGAPAATNRGFFARFLVRDEKNNVYVYSQQQNGFYFPDFPKQELIPAEKNIPDFRLNELLKNGFTIRSVQMLDHEMIATFSRVSATGSEEYLSYNNTVTGTKILDQIRLATDGEQKIASAFPLNDSVFLLNSYFGEPSLYNARSREVKPVADHPLWFSSWPDGLGVFVWKDEKNIWVGTSKNLLQSPLRTNFFKNNTALSTMLKNSKALVSYNNGIYSQNRLWVACIGVGVFSLDTVNNTATAIFNPRTPAAFRQKIVSTDILDAGKNMWVFSVYGPAAINRQTGSIAAIEGAGKDPAFDQNASYPLKDSRGRIWATLPNGISCFDIAEQRFTNYKSRYFGGNFPLLRAGVKTEDLKGNIWMARQDTLVRFDRGKEQFTSILLAKNGRQLRPVTSLASDGNDLLYLSVAGSFGIYTISTGAIELFGKQTGIVSTAINDIASDKSGNAWMATEGGLVFYDKERKRFSSFTQADGLPDDNVISINFTDSSRRNLFLGFSKSYRLFEPTNFLLEKNLPLNIITGIEADGDLPADNIAPVLSYDQNNISFTYTGINYNQGQLNNYACILEGLDKDWKYPGAERKINYLNLGPGHYTFKVKSANYQGDWNEQAAEFAFDITPPFWQRWWFRTLAVLIVLSLIYLVIKRREIGIQKENSLQLQMSELRMQALRAQMNPHFIFNSLNSIQNYILSNNTLDAASYLSRFAKLMRRILDQSKHNFLPLGEVMETLQLYVQIEAFRFNNEFSYSFDIAQDDDLLDARIPPMLLQPFVENAILHGLMPKSGDKKLQISCKVADNKVEILIDDNGIGRTQQQPKAGHESQGEKLTAGMLDSFQQLQNTKASIEIIDKKENELPAGTTIRLTLPLKK